MTHPLSRRSAIQCLTLCSLSLSGVESNAINVKLQATDPEALKLGYVENAARVDPQKYPTFKKGQSCANCQLVQLRYGPMRPCTLFPGKMVAAAGWCNGWTVTTFVK